MKKIALLPMKGNSERVPNKNVRLLGDKPLFCHIADTLLETGIFDALCINTDSEKIKDIARTRYPSEKLILHNRPEHLCGDTVPMNEIIAYDLSMLDLHGHYLQTHSTNPFVSVATIVSAYETFMKGISSGYDSLFSATRYQSRFFDVDFRPINHKEDELLRTQDLPPVYEENSCLYFFTRESFSENRSRIGLRPHHFITNAGDVEFTDIDTEAQWMLAESVLQSKSKEAL